MLVHYSKLIHCTNLYTVQRVYCVQNLYTVQRVYCVQSLYSVYSLFAVQTCTLNKEYTYMFMNNNQPSRHYNSWNIINYTLHKYSLYNINTTNCHSLYSVWQTMYEVHYAVYEVQCTYTVRTLYDVHCTYTVRRTVQYSVRRTVQYSVRRTVQYSVRIP